MTTLVDARGLACPQPVIQTRRAMQAGNHVVTVVDNEAAVANVSRMAEKAGWQVTVSGQAGEYRIELTQGAATAQSAPLTMGRAEGLPGPLVMVISADQMGRGERELGEILIRSFLHTLGEVKPRPDTVLLFNSGVRLACEGSAVLGDLQALEAQGVEILVCGTCLGFFELKEKLAAGRISNMYAIAETMVNAGRVVSL